MQLALFLHGFLIERPTVIVFFLLGFLTCDIDREPLAGIAVTTSLDDSTWDIYSHVIPSPFQISSEPVRFTALPLGGQFRPPTDVTLTCEINCPTEEKSCPSVYWTVNEVVVATSSGRFLVNETTLTILNFDEGKEGQYACHADNDLYSISSYPVELRIPSK